MMNGIEQTPSPIKGATMNRSSTPGKNLNVRKASTPHKKRAPRKRTPLQLEVLKMQSRNYRAKDRLEATKLNITQKEVRDRRREEKKAVREQNRAAKEMASLFSPNQIPTTPSQSVKQVSYPSVVPSNTTPTMSQFLTPTHSLFPPPTPKPQGFQEHVNTPVKTPPRDTPYFLTKHQTPIKKEVVDFAKRRYNANDEELADLDDEWVDKIERAQRKVEREEITIREREQDEILGIAAKNAINVLAGINQRQDSRRRDLDKQEEDDEFVREVGKKFRNSF